jgi:hypothetical protein
MNKFFMLFFFVFFAKSLGVEAGPRCTAQRELELHRRVSEIGPSNERFNLLTEWCACPGGPMNWVPGGCPPAEAEKGPLRWSRARGWHRV